jgi:hypothetical protein
MRDTTGGFHRQRWVVSPRRSADRRGTATAEGADVPGEYATRVGVVD